MAASQRVACGSSLHQYMEQVNGRVGPSTCVDDTGHAEIAKEQALAVDDHESEEDSKKKQSRQDPDDTSDFEYGGKEMAVCQADAFESSLHQFMEQEDGSEDP